MNTDLFVHDHFTQEEVEFLQKHMDQLLALSGGLSSVTLDDDLIKQIEEELDKQHPITKEIAITDVYPVELDIIEEENNGSI